MIFVILLTSPSVYRECQFYENLTLSDRVLQPDKVTSTIKPGPILIMATLESKKLNGQVITPSNGAPGTGDTMAMQPATGNGTCA